MAALTTKEAFYTLFGGNPSVEKLMLDLDLSQIVTSDTANVAHITHKLAHSFGNLDAQSAIMLDDKLKTAVDVVLKKIAAIPENSRTWEAIMSALHQCAVLKPASEVIRRVKTYTSGGLNVLRLDGSPDEAEVERVRAWFHELIDDEDVREATPIDITALANIVAQTGATINSPEAIFFKEENHSMTVLDIGIIRFPNLSNPHVLIYRIKLVAHSKCDRVLFVQVDSNGITGEFTRCSFKPNVEIMELEPAIVKQGAVEFKDMFSSYFK